MKLMRVLSRLAVLSLAAGVFVGLTAVYGGSVHRPLPDPDFQTERQHRPAAPHFSSFPEFIGEGILVIFFAVVGRIILRLRLSPPSRNEGKPILLGLHEEGKSARG